MKSPKSQFLSKILRLLFQEKMAMMELNLLLMKETDNEKMHFWPISRPSPEKPSSQILQLKEN